MGSPPLASPTTTTDANANAPAIFDHQQRHPPRYDTAFLGGWAPGGIVASSPHIRREKDEGNLLLLLLLLSPLLLRTRFETTWRYHIPHASVSSHPPCAGNPQVLSFSLGFYIYIYICIG